MQLKKWVSGVYSEVEFWKVWIRTHGAFRRNEYDQRLDCNAVLDRQAASLLPADIPTEEIKILDVGSGPLSGLGVMHEGKRLAVLAADPLAKAYQSMYRKYDVVPPVPVQLAFAEDLAVFFRKNEFDLVVCQNALDHMFDPWRALRQMIEVSKPGGWVLLRHSRNEAVNEGYSGLHQWNLDTNSDGEFILWNKQQSLNVNRLLAGQVEVKLLTSGPQHIVVALSKSPDVSLFDSRDAEERLKVLLTELSDLAVSLGREGVLMRFCFFTKTYLEYFYKKVSSLTKRTIKNLA